jgi:flagellar motor switch protein FliN/FliY
MSVLETIPNAKLILDQWTESLADVLGSMTDQRPAVSWRAVDGPPGTAEQETLWWEQPFQATPEMVVWVAAPRAVWEYAGTITLQAAGLETVELAEARNTWFEILGQSLGVMARSLGAVFGREITCDPGVERATDGETPIWASVALQFPGAPLPPLAIALAPGLLSLLASPLGNEAGQGAGTAQARRSVPTTEAPAQSRTMDLLLDVDLPVSISFGKTQVALKDVLKLTTGSIVELNRGVNDQVEVLVNQCLIARGEVVVVEGNYGVRIQEIASRQDRLRSLR